MLDNCVWNRNKNSVVYITDCGYEFALRTEGQEKDIEQFFVFCPYCGEELKIIIKGKL